MINGKIEVRGTTKLYFMHYHVWPLFVFYTYSLGKIEFRFTVFSVYSVF